MKRYNPDEVAGGCDMLEDPKGEWIKFDEICWLLTQIRINIADFHNDRVRAEDAIKNLECAVHSMTD